MRTRTKFFLLNIAGLILIFAASLTLQMCRISALERESREISAQLEELGPRLDRISEQVEGITEELGVFFRSQFPEPPAPIE